MKNIEWDHPVINALEQIGDLTAYSGASSKEEYEKLIYEIERIANFALTQAGKL